MTDHGTRRRSRPGWWAPGLALAERPRRRDPRPVEHARASGSPVARRVRRGRLVRLRLAADGLDEDALLALLAEPPAALAARVPRPAWVDTVERAVARRPRRRSVNTTDWRAAFAMPLRPFVADAVDDLTDRVTAVGTARGPGRGHRRVRRPAVPPPGRPRDPDARPRAEHQRGRPHHGAADFAAQLTEPAGLAQAVHHVPGAGQAARAGQHLPHRRDRRAAHPVRRRPRRDRHRPARRRRPRPAHRDPRRARRHPPPRPVGRRS